MNVTLAFLAGICVGMFFTSYGFRQLWKLLDRILTIQERRTP